MVRDSEKVGKKMTKQLAKVKREKIASCMTCPICKKVLRDATTISECLHTFCRKCIYKKLSDDEVDCCPICNIDLGCVPVDKLRQDHNLQDVRSKIFPLKRRKVRAPEGIPPISLPVRRKERSLSSLVVSTPRVSTQTGLTGRRTKSVTRKNAALKGSKFSMEEHIKKEESPVEDHLESLSSPETLNKIAQNKRQISFSAESSNHQTSNKDKENGVEPWEGKVDLWKPLHCLVEAANRTKSFKFSSQGSIVKSEPTKDPDGEVNVPKPKMRGRVRKPKVQDEKNNTPTLGLEKPRKLRVGRKRASASWELGKSAQAILDSSSEQNRGISPIWFTLVASEEQAGDAPLPQISARYLRIKDRNMPVSFIQKYLVKKLNLLSEDEVEIICRGQPVVPTLHLHNLVDLWLRTAPISERVPASVGISAKDFVMVLAYGRKVQHP